VPVGLAVAEIRLFFDFSSWRPFAILDFLYACLYHPRSIFVGLYCCAKFGLNRRCSFEDIAIFNIIRVVLENAYSRPFWGVLSKNGRKRKLFAVLHF